MLSEFKTGTQILFKSIENMVQDKALGYLLHKQLQLTASLIAIISQGLF